MKKCCRPFTNPLHFLSFSQMSNEQLNYWKNSKKVCNQSIIYISLSSYLTIFIAIDYLAGEVPVTKLAALQKVLQSDFLSSVREVYEHVYETVDIQGSQVHILYNFLVVEFLIQILVLVCFNPAINAKIKFFCLPLRSVLCDVLDPIEKIIAHLTKIYRVNHFVRLWGNPIQFAQDSNTIINQTYILLVQTWTLTQNIKML